MAASPVSETSPSRLERASPEALVPEGIRDQLAGEACSLRHQQLVSQGKDLELQWRAPPQGAVETLEQDIFAQRIHYGLQLNGARGVMLDSDDRWDITGSIDDRWRNERVWACVIDVSECWSQHC